jgi:hypothetical protein
MFALRRFPSLLVICGMTAFVAGLVLPEGLRAALAEPADLPPASPPASGVLPDLPAYIGLRAPESVVVSRDPFMNGEPTAAEVSPPEMAPDSPASPDALPFLPPNAGASGTPLAGESLSSALPTAGGQLLATALGRRPCALVNDGGSTRIVRIGDRLGASMVTGIRPGVILLGAGGRLEIGER